MLELCQRVDTSDRPTYGDLLGGTLFGNLYQCFSDVAALMVAPSETGSALDRYSEFDSLQTRVLQYLAKHHSTRCDLLDAIGAVSVPPPSSQWSHVTPIAAGADAGPQVEAVTAYHAAIDAAVGTVQTTLWTLFMECVCLQLLPPCPTDPGDDRLTLACLEVKGGRIIDICNFERKQVVTFPALLWWLSILPIGPLFGRVLEELCCGDGGQFVGRMLGGATVAHAQYGLMGQPADTEVMATQLAHVVTTALRGAGANLFQPNLAEEAGDA